MKSLLYVFLLLSLLITIPSYSQNKSEFLRKLRLEDVSIYGNYHLNTQFNFKSSAAVLLYKSPIAAGLSTRLIKSNFGIGFKSIIAIPLLNDGYICHLFYTETWVPFYIGASVDYFPRISSFAIIPALGYNFRVTEKFKVNANINYIFIDNSKKEEWGQFGKFNIGLGIMYTLAKYVGPFQKW